MKYYLQANPPSLRRFPKNGGPGEIWKPADQKWSPDCSTERACQTTGDELVTLEQAREFTKEAA